LGIYTIRAIPSVFIGDTENTILRERERERKGRKERERERERKESIRKRERDFKEKCGISRIIIYINI